MEKIITVLKINATGKTFKVKWDTDNEKSLIEIKQFTWLEVGQNVKTEKVAIEIAKDFIRNNQNLL